ncbi:OmpA/MotB family protein [Pseudomonas sp. PSKL.D1]|uniref:OmpA/MotB family protein n=1 Tax=Pseudomonas sp. PSKL.D1 TaxID=3029060 RepID=UPI0023811A6A|nr:OmpA family protein [Pseudomonas sp. PSKL.D1]WDY57919.1 OmpA family protein [Pseudomonas sp. PSKL.D1]
MTPSSPSSIADNRHWLAHQRALETELAKARERQCNLKRTGPGGPGASPTESDGDGWMLTYLDLMTLLLVMVLAMLAHNMTRASQAPAVLPPPVDISSLTHIDPPGSLLLVPPVVAEPEPQEPVAVVEEPPVAATPEPPSSPLDELPLDQLGSDIEVIHNARSVSFRIDSSILFPSGQTDLDPKGMQVLQRLAQVLSGVPHRIVVAGHTDTRTIRNAQYPSNWELSGARAGSVVRYLQQQGIASNRLSAVGLAATQPLADNSSAEGRAKNRRVELTLEAAKP